MLPFPLLSLLLLIPGVGTLLGNVKAWVVEAVVWALLAVAIAVAGAVAYEHVYDRGVAAERGYTLAAQAERETWRNRAVQAEATAADNERAALALGRSL